MSMVDFLAQRKCYQIFLLQLPASILSVLFLFIYPAVHRATAAEMVGDLMELSLEQLVDIEVVSVSKRSQKLSDTAAAVHVITQEDIRRSGATTIPDVLRMVPGLSVARIDTNKWAVSARGFNGRFANKLLVLMDGRSVYSPLFSGVLWDLQEIVLEDVSRIEVIRGPGATIWGANAVNGVINIITKSAQDTQGATVTAGGGTVENGFGTVRFGGKARGGGFYRVYAKYFNRDDGELFSGGNGHDGWDGYLVGVRSDWKDKIMLQAEIKSGDSGDILETPTLVPPYTTRVIEDISTFGGHFLGKWQDQLSPTSNLSAQLYYDRAEYDFSLLNTAVDTLDLDLQHQVTLGRHTIVWGMGYRFIHDDLENKHAIFRIEDATSDYHLFNGFIQDELAWMDGAFRLTLGTKVEHNDYTGFEVQPNIRVLYAPGHHYSCWGAISRAVRTPSRIEDGFRVDTEVIPPGTTEPPSPIPGVVRVVGNTNYDSEALTAFEIGLRIWSHANISLDIATFYNIYDDLRHGDVGEPFLEMTPFPPHIVLPTTANNAWEAETYGVELSMDWLIRDNWKLKANYSFLRVQVHTENGEYFGDAEADAEGNSPEHQVNVMANIKLYRNLELDLWGRYVDTLRIRHVDSYITLDARVGWQITPSLNLSVVGRNLLDKGFLENRSEFLKSSPTETERSVYGKLTWQF